MESRPGRMHRVEIEERSALRADRHSPPSSLRLHPSAPTAWFCPLPPVQGPKLKLHWGREGTDARQSDSGTRGHIPVLKRSRAGSSGDRDRVGGFGRTEVFVVAVPCGAVQGERGPFRDQEQELHFDSYASTFKALS